MHGVSCHGRATSDTPLREHSTAEENGGKTAAQSITRSTHLLHLPKDLPAELDSTAASLGLDRPRAVEALLAGFADLSVAVAPPSKSTYGTADRGQVRVSGIRDDVWEAAQIRLKTVGVRSMSLLVEMLAGGLIRGEIVISVTVTGRVREAAT